MSELRTNRIVPRDGLPAGAAGGIVQVKHASQSSTVTSTSNSAYTDVLECALTPVRNGNKILVLGNVNGYSNDVSGTDWTNSAYIKLDMKEDSGSYSRIAQFEHPGIKIDSEICIVTPIHYMSGSLNAGTVYTYKICVKNTGSGDTWSWGRSTDGCSVAENGCRLTLMEVSG